MLLYGRQLPAAAKGYTIDPTVKMEYIADVNKLAALLRLKGVADSARRTDSETQYFKYGMLLCCKPIYTHMGIDTLARATWWFDWKPAALSLNLAARFHAVELRICCANLLEFIVIGHRTFSNIKRAQT